jgi:hypothetical protein
MRWVSAREREMGIPVWRKAGFINAHIQRAPGRSRTILKYLKVKSLKFNAAGPGRFFLFIFLILIFPFSGTAAGFKMPEKLIFDLTWTGIKAGTATMEILDDVDSARIISTARSADWVSAFYTVDDRVESLLAIPGSSSTIGLPQRYTVKLREGTHRRDKEVRFDHAAHRAVYMDHLKKKKQVFGIEGDVFDPLSSFYLVRKARLEVGNSLFVDIFDSKKVWNVEIQVLRKEKIKTCLGSFDTVVIKPLMKSEGIFNRKGDMTIWLTDDDKRIPVMMKTKVVVGSVTATLVGGKY